MSSPTAVLLGVLVVLGAAVALWASSDLAIAAPAATLACLALVGLAASTLVERLRPTRNAPPAPERDSLVLLGDAFHNGILGRRSILSTVRALEVQAFGDRVRPLTLDEEERLLASPQPEFRAWVEKRLVALERVA